MTHHVGDLHCVACLDRSPIAKENIQRLHGIWREPYKLIQWVFMNDMEWTMWFASLCLLQECVIQHQCRLCTDDMSFLSPSKCFNLQSFVAFSFLLSLFFSWGSSLERMLIKTRGGEWHLESDRWKGIKLSLQPTVRHWYRPPPPFAILPSQADYGINIFKWEVSTPYLSCQTN